MSTSAFTDLDGTSEPDATRLCDQALAAPTHLDGWGCMYFNGTYPPYEEHYAYNDDIAEGNDCRDVYVQYNVNDELIGGEVFDAIEYDAYQFLAHSRRNPGATIDGPHPFVYNYGDDYFSLAHNGSIYSSCDLGTDIGAKFACLDLFVDRQHSPWARVDNTEVIVDTEFYAALVMKYHLIAENYYELEDFPTPTWYGIQAAVTKIHNRGTVTYSSLNALTADDERMHLVYDQTDDNHDVSYFSQLTTPLDLKMATTTAITGGGWNSLTSTSIDYIRTLEPGLSRSAESSETFTTLNPIELGTTELEVEELRINRQDESAGDQISPAVSVDPVNSSFAVVWKDEESGDLKLSWRNQMGLAEGPAHTIEIAGDDCREPAIDHTSSGDQVMVVWSEKPQGGSAFSVIHGKVLTWDYDTRSWSESLTASYATASSSSDNLLHPSVAARTTSDFAIVWQRTISKSSSIEIRLFAACGGNQLSDVLVNNITCRHFEPDVVELDGGNDIGYVMTWGTSCGTLFHMVQARTILNCDLDLGNVTTIASASSHGSYFNPVVDWIRNDTPNKFYLGYYNSQTDNYKAHKITANTNGTLTVNSTLTSETVTSIGNLDIAARKDNEVELCYEKNNDIYLAVSSGGSFGTPIAMNTTTASTQELPSMAISYDYKSPLASQDGRGWNYYDTMSSDGDFDERRLVVWESDEQDNADDSWGIVGRLNGISSTDDMAEWYENDQIDMSQIGNCTSPAPPGGERRGNLSQLDEDADTDASVVTPEEYSLEQPYPNPFNPTTTLEFTVPEDAHVRIDVYDVNGRMVDTLIDEVVQAGRHIEQFSGVNFPSGAYFAVMKSGGFKSTQKMLLIK